jgi:hypothetical protein
LVLVAELSGFSLAGRLALGVCTVPMRDPELP